MQFLKEYRQSIDEAAAPSKSFQTAMRRDAAKKERLKKMAASWMKKTGKSKEDAEKEFDVKLEEVRVGESTRTPFFSRGSTAGEYLVREIERYVSSKVQDEESDEYRDLVFRCEEDFLTGLSQEMMNPISVHNVD